MVVSHISNVAGCPRTVGSNLLKHGISARPSGPFYQLVEQHYPAFLQALAVSGRDIPEFVRREFDAYLKCGRLVHGFLRVRFIQCHAEQLVAFSCKRRSFCPSCGARRMVETAGLLVDEVLPRDPLRQWVLSVPFPLCILIATEPAALTAVQKSGGKGEIYAAVG